MKKIFAVLAAAAVMVISAIPAFASIPEEYASTRTIPTERLQPRLVDDADILSDYEESLILKKLDRISEEYQIDVAIFTCYSLGNRSAQAYADDYYDYNGFGFGESRDGFVLMISMEQHESWFSGNGKGKEIFTDYGQDFMWDQILPELKEGEYAEAFNEFADISEDFIKEWKKGTPYDVNHMAKGKLHPGWIIGALIGGAVIGLIVSESIKAQLTSVSMQHGADDYIRKNSFKLTVQRDNFLYKNVTKTRIESSSGSSGRSGGGGTSTHHSSSGSSHSGSGRRF
jgi:uncharacterized protein